MVVTKPQTNLLMFLGLFSLALGFESGNEYTYKYVVRSVSGTSVLNERNAVIEIRSRVTVQSVDAFTLIISFLDSRIKRNGRYLGNVYNTDEEFDGEDPIADYEYEFLSAPFSVSHNNKGSITEIKIGADEHQWIVNLKKSFASQLQLDVNGFRGPMVPDDSFIVFENFMNGRCSTKVDITKLPVPQVYSSKINNLDAFKTTCRDNQAYRIVKTTDFKRCKTNRFRDSTTSNADYDNVLDNDKFLKRNLVSKYMTCGKSLSESTVVIGESYISLPTQSFSGSVDWNKENDLVKFAITHMELEQVKEISFLFRVRTNTKGHNSLAHDFYFFDQWKQHGSSHQLNDFDFCNNRKCNFRTQSRDFDNFNQRKRSDQLNDADSYNQWKRNSYPT